MSNLIFPTDFDEKLDIAQDDYILFSDSEDSDRIKKAKYSNLKWEKWDAATIAVGSTTTWWAWTSASVINSWTSSAAVLDFTIPKWDKWDTWDTWATWASIVSATFSWDDMVFTKDDGNTVTLSNAKTDLKWDTWDTWATGASIVSWAFVSNDLVFTKDDSSTVTISNAKTDLKWDTWASIISWAFVSDDLVFTKDDSSTVTITDAKVDLKWDTGTAATIAVWTVSTWAAWSSATITNTWTSSAAVFDFSIPQWDKWDTWATWNWIASITSSKSWKITTVTITETDWDVETFTVSDWADWQWAWDVIWPNSSTDWNVVLFDWITWKLIKDSGVTLSSKQDTLTAWNWIDITSNKISTTFVYWESSTAAATVQKEVSIPSITSLNVWQVIIVKPSTTSSVASSTLKLNSFPAYKMLYNGAEITTSTDSVVWTANVPSMFYLDEVSGTKYWRFLGHWLDSNSTYTLNQLLDAWRYEAWAGTYAIDRYALCMMKPDWTWEKLTATNVKYSTWTTKNVNTNWFVLNQIKYYNTTTNVANWAFVGTNTFSSQAASVRADYSFNCGTAPWWSVWDPIYIVWTIWADGLFYLDTTARWSTTLPSTNDWKLYIRIWTALTTTDATISFLVDRPIFYYDNWIKEYTSSKQDKISDLATIRSGAWLWATAVQPWDLWTAASKDTWTSSWNVPVLDSNWKLATSTLPWVALTDTFTVSTSADLITLSSADQWDIAIVTSENKTYVLSVAPYSTAANWKEILAPTWWVTSVNTQTWAVVLDADDISDSTTTNKFVTASDKTTWSWKQDALVSGTNIKTINWNSLLWNWDLTIQAWVTSVNWNTWAVTVREVPSVWTNWQVLTVVSWAAAWANAAWSDYSWVTKTISWWEIELWLRTIVNVPTSNFTLTAPATLKDWEEYAIRIISETSYTMTLWTWFTNPRNVDTTLSGNATDQYVFLAINGELELQPLVDTWA